MNSLTEKIRKARHSVVEAGGIKFTVRRPTDLEMVEGRLYKDVAKQSVVLRDFVIGWDAKEIDIIPGGTPDPVDFESDLFMEWVSDQPNLWSPLISHIVNAYQLHAKQSEATEKKPSSG